jgi:hypothetical protein
MRSLLVALALVTISQAANAITITATVSGGPANNPVIDVQGPATSGQLLAQVTIPVDAFSDMTARAAQDLAGNSALELDGVYASSAKPQDAGVFFPQVTDGVTTWTASVTNNSMVPKRYIYSFALSPIELELINNNVNAADPLAPAVSYGVEVRANNVLLFESHALFKGGGLGHVLIETGTDLGGVFSINEGTLQYDFASFQGVLDVGTAQPGATITVEAKLIGHTEAHRDYSGGEVDVGDPLDLKNDPGIFSVIFGEDDEVGVAPVSWSAAKHLYR